jgi:hypothetical protein
MNSATLRGCSLSTWSNPRSFEGFAEPPDYLVHGQVWSKYERLQQFRICRQARVTGLQRK